LAFFVAFVGFAFFARFAAGAGFATGFFSSALAGCY
jgi:hypothetical protein